jgi:hypothetical protein
MIESYISKLAVIQSLPNGDSQTGRRLYEDIKMLNIFYARRLKMEYMDICCKEELFAYLSQLKEESSKGLWPLIHLECHGLSCQTGISLGDGSSVLWQELYPYFSAINKNTKLNLILVAGLCYGAYFSELFSPIDKAPFLMAIGPTKQIKNEEIETSFLEFYKSYFCSSNGTEAGNKLINRKLDEGYFYITMATTIFKKFFKAFLFELNNQNDIEKIIRETTINGNTHYLIDGHTKYKYCEAVFNRYYDKFFMVDLYPENKDRFKFSFKDIEHELQL